MQGQSRAPGEGVTRGGGHPGRGSSGEGSPGSGVTWGEVTRGGSSLGREVTWGDKEGSPQLLVPRDVPDLLGHVD